MSGEARNHEETDRLREENERLRRGLSQLLLYARGNPHVLAKIHALIDGDDDGR